MTGDPSRLRAPESEAPEALRLALEQAHADLPTPEALGRIAAGLEHGVPPSGAGETAAASGGAHLPFAVKLGAVLLVGGAAVVALVRVVEREPGAPPVASTPAQVATANASDPVVPAIPVPAADRSPPERGAMSTRVPSTARSDEVGGPATPSSAGSGGSTPAVRRAPGEAAETPATSPDSQSADRGPSEAALLGRAQSALKNDPALAAALAREHARRFPAGALAQEREVILIEAAKRLGNDSEAKKRSGDFREQFPGSAHEERVRRGGR